MPRSCRAVNIREFLHSSADIEVIAKQLCRILPELTVQIGDTACDRFAPHVVRDLDGCRQQCG
jgi:hypothetical protein